MSEKLTGVLEKKEFITSKSGARFVSIVVNGTKMSAFLESTQAPNAYREVEGCREGNTIEVEYDTDKTGKYKNIKTITVQASGSSQTLPQVDSGGTAPSARDAAITLGGIGHDVAAIIGGILNGRAFGEIGPVLSWVEENYPRIVALYSTMSDELFGVRTTALYGPQGG